MTVLIPDGPHPAPIGFHTITEPRRRWIKRLLSLRGPLRRKTLIVDILDEADFKRVLEELFPSG
ncbi:MAG: hypothetical protein ACJ768_12850 [Gaiellaceae bacterium]